MTRIDAIERFFRDRVGREVTTLEITVATGTLAPSTKVSQLRDRGMDIRLTRDDRVNGTRICGYTYLGAAPSSPVISRIAGSRATGLDELFTVEPEQPN